MSLRPTDENAGFIWATRGRTWGFRFLRKGGYEDPLGVYEDAFSKVHYAGYRAARPSFARLLDRTSRARRLRRVSVLGREFDFGRPPRTEP